jgi:hypothetical protein
VPSSRRDEAAARFEADCVRVFSEAAQEAVNAGIASLEEGQDGGGSYLRLTPHQPSACQITLYADYPTLCLGPEQHCTEMFGSEESRLRELRQLVQAVIEGRYEWEHRQVTKRVLFFRYRYTELRGTFHTDEGPWVFTRMGGEPRGATQRRTYAPY